MPIDRAVAAVERTIERHRLTEREADGLREVVLSLVAERRSAVASDRVQQERVLQRVEDERQKLLQAHYANAVPLDLMRSEMDRLERERDTAQRRLAAADVELDQVEAALEDALRLAKDCAQMYAEAPAAVRRLINQALFEKLYLGWDEGVEAVETVDLFTILFDPETPGRLKSEASDRVTGADAAERRRRRSAEADSAPSDGLSSSKTLLVREEGLEPSRPFGHRNLNPARLPIPPLARVDCAL